MVNAIEVITVLNKFYDGDERREKLLATMISGVSFHHVVGVKGTESRSENLACKIRIPLSAEVEDGKSYIDEAEYRLLSEDEAKEHWTLQKGCYVLYGPQSGSYESEADLSGVPFYTVVEYADNTRRGSEAVRHWRIGGA